MIDMVILHLGAEFFMGPTLNAMAEVQKLVSNSAGHNRRQKLFVVALSSEGQVRDAEKYAQELREIGVPAYGSLRTACRALNRFADYYKFLAESKT
jgi:uncharacterized caspase-like protein